MMAFARWLFRIAGVYGLVALVPQYFLEQKPAIALNAQGRLRTLGSRRH
jgi:hypothetical protein